MEEASQSSLISIVVEELSIPVSFLGFQSSASFMNTPFSKVNSQIEDENLPPLVACGQLLQETNPSKSISLSVLFSSPNYVGKRIIASSSPFGPNIMSAYDLRNLSSEPEN